jgi:hypothetical protein
MRNGLPYQRVGAGHRGVFLGHEHRQVNEAPKLTKPISSNSGQLPINGYVLTPKPDMWVLERLLWIQRGAFWNAQKSSISGSPSAADRHTSSTV